MNDPALLGALIGLAVGIANFAMLTFIRAHRTPESQDPWWIRKLGYDVVRYGELVLFPLIGWFAGSFFF
jgi:uncharacterized membrane protein required for colicin V production